MYTHMYGCIHTQAFASKENENAPPHAKEWRNDPQTSKKAHQDATGKTMRIASHGRNRTFGPGVHEKSAVKLRDF